MVIDIFISSEKYRPNNIVYLICSTFINCATVISKIVFAKIDIKFIFANRFNMIYF